MVCQDEETRDWLLGYPPWRPPGLRWWAWILLPPIKEWWPGFWALWKIRSCISNGSVGQTRAWTPGFGESMSAKRNQRRSSLCSALILLSPNWRKWAGDPSVEWDKPSFPFWLLIQKGRNRMRRRERRGG